LTVLPSTALRPAAARRVAEAVLGSPRPGAGGALSWAPDLALRGADDGTRTRDPHLGNPPGGHGRRGERLRSPAGLGIGLASPRVRSGHLASTCARIVPRSLAEQRAQTSPDQHDSNHRHGGHEEHRNHRPVHLRAREAPAFGDGPPWRIVGTARAGGPDTACDVATATAAVRSSAPSTLLPG
jgi:hypothetical protein